MSRLPALAAVLTLALAPAAAGADETLPTPYTAEQIRNAFRPGTSYTLTVESPQGVVATRTTVLAADLVQATLESRALGAAGEPAGEPEVEVRAWTELRDHARFPAGQARRERVRRSTAFGELEGWLYRVEGEGGARSELFFADRYPGPPLRFERVQGDTVLMRAEVTERREGR